jgi:hypothetical protein
MFRQAAEVGGAPHGRERDTEPDQPGGDVMKLFTTVIHECL